MKNTSFSRYPDPWAEGLRIKLAQYTGVAKKNIMVGNDFYELSQLILLSFGYDGQILITPPTSAIDNISSVVPGTKGVNIPLKDDVDIDWEFIYKEGQKPEIKVIFICSPKNQKGNLVSIQAIEKILQQTKAIVVLVGACYQFAGQTCADLLAKYQNLIILRTFAEAFGRADIKIGFLLAGRAVLRELVKVKMPYNLNVFSQRVAEIFLENILPKQTKIKRMERKKNVETEDQNNLLLIKLKEIVG